MKNSSPHPTVQDLESRFFRRWAWWLSPVLAIAALLLKGDVFWGWVDVDYATWQPAQLLHLRTCIVAALACVPLVMWRVTRHIALPEPLIWSIAVLGLILFDAAIRLSTAQAPLWLAARARLHPGQSFMSEVCYVRLEENAGRENQTPSVMLVGSSQMLNGIDARQLREDIAPVPVIRRAMFGMTPLKALAMLSYMPFQNGDTCVQYLSEFDFSNQDAFPASWFRPYASWQTLPQVVRCIGPSATLRNSGRLMDYAMAATWESWRTRDFLHQILLNAWGPSPLSQADTDKEADALRAIAEKQENIVFSAAEKSAFEQFHAALKTKGVRMLVLEGDVSPKLYTPSRLAAKATTREWLSTFDQPPTYHYIPREEQRMPQNPDLWKDMTHLNAEGRTRLTQMLAEILRMLP